MRVVEVKEVINKLHLNGLDEPAGKAYGQLPSPFDDVPYCRNIKPRLAFMDKNYDFKNMKFLDLGCNAGHYCFALADWSAYGIGVDNDTNCIHVADLVKESLAYDGLSFVCKDILEFQPDYYDVILFLSTYQWLVQQHGLQKVNDYLKMLSKHAKTMFFETAGTDSKAPLAEADDFEWITSQLNACGWSVVEQESLPSEVGGLRRIMKCSSKNC